MTDKAISPLRQFNGATPSSQPNEAGLAHDLAEPGRPRSLRLKGSHRLASKGIGQPALLP